MAEVEAGCASTFMVKDHFRLGRNWLVVGILLALLGAWVTWLMGSKEQN